MNQPFAPLYAALKAAKPIPAIELRPGDQVITKGHQ
jgi:hypothetical protein